MDTTRVGLLLRLLDQPSVGALGTLHRGRPAVSMVPFARLPGAASLVIHVSALATHTADMRACADVALLVTSDPEPGVSALGRPRLSLTALAQACPGDHPAHTAARGAYLARFADAAPMFEFSDFSLFLLEPQSARLVGGFGQAWSLTREQILQAMVPTGASDL